MNLVPLEAGPPRKAKVRARASATYQPDVTPDRAFDLERPGVWNAGGYVPQLLRRAGGFEVFRTERGSFKVGDRVREGLIPTWRGAQQIEGEMDEPQIRAKERRQPGRAEGVFTGFEKESAARSTSTAAAGASTKRVPASASLRPARINFRRRTCATRPRGTSYRTARQRPLNRHLSHRAAQSREVHKIFMIMAGTGPTTSRAPARPRAVS